jgi:hypothetical protein
MNGGFQLVMTLGKRKPALLKTHLSDSKKGVLRTKNDFFLSSYFSFRRSILVRPRRESTGVQPTISFDVCRWNPFLGVENKAAHSGVRLLTFLDSASF